MWKEKQRYIQYNGVEIKVYKAKDEIGSTKAIIGRVERLTGAVSSVDAKRICLTLPEPYITPGVILEEVSTGIKYIVVTVMNEMLGGGIASYVCTLYKCNTEVDIRGDITTADEVGNIRKTPGDKYIALPVYMDTINSSLVMFKPGYVIKSKYVIYASDIDVDILDKVKVLGVAGMDELQIETLDRLQSPGLLVLGVKTLVE